MLRAPTFTHNERTAAAAILWHFEDDDVKKENASLRQSIQSLRSELDTLRAGHDALDIQRKADTSALRVAQHSLQYERRVNTELEEMHRLASENLRNLRAELRAIQGVTSDDAVRAAHLRVEELLLGAGWKREEDESLDHTLKRALDEHTARLHTLQQENSDLRSHVSLLEMFWNQPLDPTQLSGFAGGLLDDAAPPGVDDAPASTDIMDTGLLPSASFDSLVVS